MALTPQMRQSIQLLGMSSQDLADYIEVILEKNPFLTKYRENARFEKLKQYGLNTRTSRTLEYDDNRRSQRVNPREALVSQIRMLGLDSLSQEIAEYLIYELDDNGYLTSDLDRIADNFTVTRERVEEILDVVQDLDPPGIAARSITECLQIQLRRMKRASSLEYAIVTDHVRELARNDYEAIAKALGEDAGAVKKALAAIKALNPRPASSLLSEGAPRVNPDLIARIKGRKITIAINRQSVPQLKLYNPYEQDMPSVKDDETREFFKENMSTAKQLMDGLKRREETLCKVATYILEFQRKHIERKGPMNCLRVSDVADALGLHASTISRSVSNKFVEINDEVIPLKSLLSQGMPNGNGDHISKASVKNRILSIVNKEDKTKPFSDEAIKTMLQREGIAIERRTVAKYRESLRLLPTHLRKKKADPETSR